MQMQSRLLNGSPLLHPKAVPKAVAKAGLKMSDINYIELNEAFSVVGIANIREMKLDP